MQNCIDRQDTMVFVHCFDVFQWDDGGAHETFHTATTNNCLISLLSGCL